MNRSCRGPLAVAAAVVLVFLAGMPGPAWPQPLQEDFYSTDGIVWAIAASGTPCIWAESLPASALRPGALLPWIQRAVSRWGFRK
jgi:hypothetical protein